MSTLAILPVKSFADAKQRLGSVLPPGLRRALVEAMFSDVLIALRRAGSVDRILVISADPIAQRIAGGHGTQVLDDEQRGHNVAASLGIGWALESGLDRALLVPGDCPLLDAVELDVLCARPAPARSVLIVPDRHGTGTNALLVTPPDVISPSFGPDSRARHVALAQDAGASHEVVEVPSLALDVDTPDDLAALQAELDASRGGAAHTRGTVRQLMRSGPG
jgi:2-phospho-L-lactate/phosphoenolpyruvate guanylyltransferase